MVVSVLTPSFNYAGFLRENLRSVRYQQDAAVEHIVVDDGSVDGSMRLLEEAPEILLHRQANRGQAAALNEALRRSNGEWVCWLPADDLLLPGAAALAVETGEDTGADVVFGDTIFVDTGTRVIRLLGQHRFHETTLRWYGTYLPPPSTFIRRSVLRADPWDETMRQLLDWDLWLQLAADGARFRYHSRPFSAFRRHPGQLSQNVSAGDDAEWMRLRERHGLPPGPLHGVASAAGRALHIAGKLRSGAYRRDLVLRRHFGGRSVRWVDGGEGLLTVRRAIEAAAGAQAWPRTSR